LKAKKSYGQHFLNNESIASAIADSLIYTDQYTQVLEVGPGKGMLTKYLLQKSYQLYAVEADKDMVFYLKKHFPELKDNLIHVDFLKFNPKLIFNEAPFALIGNFPYNISSQILFWMINYRSQIPEMVGMFQKEVANRVIAKPGSKTYGVISVLIQAYYDGEFLIDVDKSNFSPPPKVQSGVIRLVRKENQNLDCDENFFKKIVKVAFSQRRKMLRNTMKSFVKGDEMLQEDFFKQRPEQLSVQDYIDLTNRIASKL
jgi:16S rRNA (adenine1518-N6/adenine1519-N6)-dimethyltransferase